MTTDNAELLGSISKSLQGLLWHIRMLSRRMTLCENALESLEDTHGGCPTTVALKAYSLEVEALRLSYNGVADLNAHLGDKILLYQLQPKQGGVSLNGD